MKKSNLLHAVLFHSLSLTLVSGAVFAHAALLPTHAGAPDPIFNGGAALVQALSPDADYPMDVVLLEDGATLLGGAGQNTTGSRRFGYVRRHLADGAIDTGYADGGTLRFGTLENEAMVRVIVPGVDGKTTLVGSSTVGDPELPLFRPWIAQAHADGTVDHAFGIGGERNGPCTIRDHCYYQGAVRLADGKFVALGGMWDDPFDNLLVFLDRYNADGTPDTAFGEAGRVVLPAALNIQPQHMVLDGAGRLVISGEFVNVAPAINEGGILRVLPDGSMDGSFGAGGSVRMRIDGLRSQFRRLAIQADGRIVSAANTHNPGASPDWVNRVVRLNTDGQPDAQFGVDGVVSLGAGYGGAVAIQSDGRIVYGARTEVGTIRAMVVRLSANGQLDPTFGVDGKAFPYTAGTHPSLGIVRVGPDDRITAAGSARPQGGNNSDSLLVRMIGTETTSNVVEFYNSTLKHYFITADPAEAAAIDNGAAGPGWSRTGEAWKSGGPARVCRFYGSPELDAVTGQRMGPNSHFYTISAQECAIVKGDAGWKFESYDFSGWPVQADGTCAQGTVAIKRVYNNKFASNDSNHRYAVTNAAYDRMLATGWTGEGTVFCAPL